MIYVRDIFPDGYELGSLIMLKMKLFGSGSDDFFAVS